MEIPVSIGGERCGVLTQRQEGLYTVLQVDCPFREGLIRLWAQGGGQSACLGLLRPEGGRLRLTRRLSRLERAAFPARIERVTDREAPDEAAAPAEEKAADHRPAEGWLRLSDGSLLAPDGTRALPAALPPSSPLAHRLRRIGGQDYLVFRL